MPNRIAPSKLLAEFVGTFALAPVPPPWRELDLPFGRDNERIEQRAQYNLDFSCTIARCDTDVPGSRFSLLLVGTDNR
jgi:hypothetical protein